MLRTRGSSICLPLISENAKIGIMIQLHNSNKKMNICLFYLIGSDTVLDPHLKRLKNVAKRFAIIGLSLEKSFSRILVCIESMKIQ